MSIQRNPIKSVDSDDLWEIVAQRALAATLIILFDGPADTEVVLTVRSLNLRTYPGETALPGGRAEKGEDWWETSLREALEEIGFEPEKFNTQRITAFPVHLSRNYLLVRPCLVYITPKDPKQRRLRLEDIAPAINESEVSAVYSLPLRHFLLKQYLDADATCLMEWAGEPWWFYRFPVNDADWIFSDPRDEKRFAGTAVTGLTAHIIVDAARWWYELDADFETEEHLGLVKGAKRSLTRGQLEPRI